MALPAPGSTVPGRGAWTTAGHSTGSKQYKWLWYWVNDGHTPQTSYSHRAVHLAIKGIQGALLLCEYPGSLPVTGKYDKATADAVKWFQTREGLKADGIVGSITAKRLFRYLIKCLSDIHDVPPDVIWGFASLESGFDPAAVGVLNGMDSGLCQINLSPEAHGNHVTPEQAFDPVFNIDYVCRRYAKAFRDFGPSKGPELQRAVSIAQHNSPLAARQWWEIGWVGPDEKIAIYVRLVEARALDYQS